MSSPSEDKNKGLAHPGNCITSSDARAEARPERVHDFRTGKQYWGHALHASTWRDLPSKKARRASVMVHCSYPFEGDRLLFTGSLAEWNVRIVGVAACGNPDDMFTLTLEFDRPPLAGGASTRQASDADDATRSNAERGDEP